MPNPARFLIIFGAVIMAVGIILLLAPKIPWLGRLPGDLLVRRRNFTFYFPIVTSIVISVLLTLLLNLFRK